MRIYISGRITGLKAAETWANFGKANRRLQRVGHKVIDPTIMSACASGLDWKAYMTIAYGILHDPSVDAIYMLANWTESTGAIIEWGWAQARGLPILYEDPAHYKKYGRRAQ